jgi:hypothetical protein
LGKVITYERRGTQSGVGLRQSCALSPALLSVFIDHVFRKLDEPNAQPSVTLMKQVSRSLFSDDLATGAITIMGLQRAINCIQEFCKWKLKINVKMIKTVVFTKRGELNKNEKWRQETEGIEEINETKYSGLILNNRRKREKERKLAINSINVCRI